MKEIYLCMGCRKIYKENPQVCIDSTGLHSKFTEDYGATHTKKGDVWCWTSDISDFIFRFSLKTESLDNIPHFTGQTPSQALHKNGYKTVAVFQYGERNERGETRKKAEEEIRRLNGLGEEYVLFSVSSRGGTSYTFMQKV